MKKKNWFYLILLLTFVALLWGVVYYVRPLYQMYRALKTPPPATAPVSPAPEETKLLQNRYYNFLLYGVDAGEWVKGSYRPGKGRADTIVLLQLDLEERTAMLSIPRIPWWKSPLCRTDKLIMLMLLVVLNCCWARWSSLPIPVDYYLSKLHPSGCSGCFRRPELRWTVPLSARSDAGAGSTHLDGDKPLPWFFATSLWGYRPGKGNSVFFWRWHDRSRSGLSKSFTGFLCRLEAVKTNLTPGRGRIGSYP